MNVATARATLADRLATVTGLHVYPSPPPQPTVPCAIVHLVSIVPTPTFDHGAAELRFDIQILVALADWAAAHATLDGYINVALSGSLIDAVNTESCDVAVTAVDNYGHVALGDIDYATVTLHLEMTISPSTGRGFGDGTFGSGTFGGN